MHRLVVLLIGLLLWGSQDLMAQSSKTKFADKYFTGFNFDAAAENYKSLLGKKKVDQTYVLTRLGDCYRLMNDTEQAEEWYGEAVNSEGVSSETLYYYGQMLRSNSKYSAARSVFERYKSTDGGDLDHVNDIISSLSDIEQLLSLNESYDIQITPFNSMSSDFSPYVYEDEVYFTSNGYPSASVKEDVWTDKMFLQVYKVEEKGYDQYGSVEALDNKQLNGSYHDGPICVDPVNKDLYLTRNNYQSRKYTKDEEKNINLKLMRKPMSGEGEWSGKEIIDDFPFNSDDYSVGHATISKDGSTLYFASDMPHEDAQGGVDLYKCTRSGGSWTDLENLGPVINTRGHERFPFIAENGHFLFSSDGHKGLGGMDLFEVLPGRNGEWGKPINMGAPLNTNHDDFAIVLKEEVREGYFTSNRPSEFADDDIYSFKDMGIRLIGKVVDAKTGSPICNSGVDMLLGSSAKGNMDTECDGMFSFPVKAGKDYDFKGCATGYGCNVSISASTKGLEPGSVVEVEIPLKKEQRFGITVIVLDEQTKQPISSSRVNFYDGCNGNRQFRQSDQLGSSKYDGQEGCEYFIGAMASKYFPKDTVISSVGIEEDMEVIIELTKDGIYDVTAAGMGEGILFHHIYYDFDESYIRGDANPDLEVVLNFMLENPSAIVQIESHTDARAPYQYNIDLSKRRASAAKSWLESKGISAGRLSAVGFGEIRPVNGCVDNLKCTEQEHQQNRRTEFRIVGGKVDTRSLARFNIAIDPCTRCPF